MKNEKGKTVSEKEERPLEALLSHFDFDKVKKGRTKYQRALDANWSQNCSRFQRNKK